MLKQGMKVFVYRNLHKGCYSIRALEGEHKGKVVGWNNSVLLSNATQKVSEAGRQRVLRDKQKNVHTGIVGNYCEQLHSIKAEGKEIYYNPYKVEKFVYKGTLDVFERAAWCLLTDGVFVFNKN